jgi:hypothetical protein
MDGTAAAAEFEVVQEEEGTEIGYEEVDVVKMKRNYNMAH